MIVSVTNAQSIAPLDTLAANIRYFDPTPANCDVIKKHSWWLPDAYINNATIACLVVPDESKSNIIRWTLQEQLNNTPNEIKLQAAKKKEAYQTGNLSKRKYRKYIIKNLTPLIYKHHQIAYKNAGCKGDPAPYQSWKFVTTRAVESRKFIWFSIRCFGGSCYAHFCKW